ncbi:MAG: GtrA family protein [Stellaceae bacterium]
MAALAIGVDAVLLKQLLRFAAVGVVGFLVNVASVYTLENRVGLYAAGAAAFVAAASVTWLANRSWTFRDRARVAASRQWVIYLGVSLIGFAFYYATYAALVALVPLCRLFPVLPVASGSLAGLLANFTLSRSVVFR